MKNRREVTARSCTARDKLIPGTSRESGTFRSTGNGRNQSPVQRTKTESAQLELLFLLRSLNALKR